MSGTNKNDFRKRLTSPVVFSNISNKHAITRPFTPSQDEVTKSLKLSQGGDEFHTSQPQPTSANHVQPSRENSNNNERQTFLTTLHSIVIKLFNPNNQELVVKAYQELMVLFLQDERFAAVFPKLTRMFFKEHEAFIKLFNNELTVDFAHLVRSTLENGAISNHLNKMSLTSIINLILIMLDTQGTTTENQNKIDTIVDDFLTKWEQTPTQSALFGTEQILLLLSHISNEQDKVKVMDLISAIANNSGFSVDNEKLFNQFIDILLTTTWIEPKIKPLATQPLPLRSPTNNTTGSSK